MSGFIPPEPDENRDPRQNPANDGVSGRDANQPAVIHLRADTQPVTKCGLSVQSPVTWKWQVPESGWVGPWRGAEVTCPDCLAAEAVNA